MKNMILHIFSTFLHVLFPEKIGGGQNISEEELLCSPLPEENLAPSIHAFFRYKHPSIRKGVWQLKYYKDKHAAGLFGKILYSYLLEEFADLTLFLPIDLEEKPLLIPIPISSGGLVERGYNQCEFLTHSLVECDTQKIFAYRPDVLSKNRDTLHQTHLTRFERIQNLSGCFFVENKSAVKNKIIFLIDDVTTTGSTFAEASRTLYESGAREIFCIALAH